MKRTVAFILLLATVFGFCAFGGAAPSADAAPAETAEDAEVVKIKITKDNFLEVFAAQLKNFKDNGFDCVNPSILKGTIQNDYPNFNERQLGCKRFSDLLKILEQDGLCSIELDEQKTMRVRIL